MESEPNTSTLTLGVIFRLAIVASVGQARIGKGVSAPPLRMSSWLRFDIHDSRESFAPPDSSPFIPSRAGAVYTSPTTLRRIA